MKVLIKLLVLIFIPSLSWGQTSYSVPHVFSAGDQAVASEVNENFDALVTAVNQLSVALSGIQSGAAGDASGTYRFVGMLSSTDYIEGDRIGGGSFGGTGTVVVSDSGDCSGSIALAGFSNNIEDGGLILGGDGVPVGGRSVNLAFTCLATSIGGTFVAQISITDIIGATHGIIVGVRE